MFATWRLHFLTSINLSAKRSEIFERNVLKHGGSVLRDVKSPDITHIFASSDYSKEKLSHLLSTVDSSVRFLEISWLSESLAENKLKPFEAYDLRLRLPTAKLQESKPSTVVLDAPEPNPVGSASPRKPVGASKFPEYSPTGQRPTMGGNFRDALVKIVKSPSADQVFYQDEQVVVIYDAFPKARYHLLVLPRRHIEDLKSLRQGDLDLLKAMHCVGWSIADCLQARGSDPFIVGYHSVPSLRLLHLHLVSSDFDSVSLNKKKHWISFQPPFFRNSADVIQSVESRGSVPINVTESEALLKGGMECHRCASKCKNIPDLKQHIARCRHVFNSQQREYRDMSGGENVVDESRTGEHSPVSQTTGSSRKRGSDELVTCEASEGVGGGGKLFRGHSEPVFKWVRSDAETETPKEIRLSVGTNMIGRGSILNDPLVSSKQLEVIVQSDPKQVLVKLVGKNSSFYRRDLGGTFVPIPRDSFVSLVAGSRIVVRPPLTDSSPFFELVFE